MCGERHLTGAEDVLALAGCKDRRASFVRSFLRSHAWMVKTTHRSPAAQQRVSSPPPPSAHTGEVSLGVLRPARSG